MNFADLDNQLLLQGPALARLTDEEFYDLCQHNPTLRLERTADHNIIAMPPAGSESSRKSGEIYGQLWLWNRQQQFGYVYDSSAGFTLPDGSVRSPSDGLAALRRKMKIYLANGVQLGFLLDPTHETVSIYRPGQPPEALTGFERELSGEEVLPGFSLDLRPLRR